MQNQNNSKKNILSRIADVRVRTSAIDSLTPSSGPIYKAIGNDILACFINELEAINGKVVVRDTTTQLYEQLSLFVSDFDLKSVYCLDPTILTKLEEQGTAVAGIESDFASMTLGITSCECLVARTGSVVVSAHGASGRRMNVFPPIHVVVATASQLVNYLDDAISLVTKKHGENYPSTISFMTGPSRTADIEKTLVLGAHGPKELFVFISKEL
jgi:L-lactate dehydrogenase complex protein LldG